MKSFIKTMNKFCCKSFTPIISTYIILTNTYPMVVIQPVSYTHLDAIMDRLVANASKIELKGDSMRQKLKK